MSGLSRDDIISMAREVELFATTSVLIKFANLVAAVEREACAKVCEQPIDEIQITDDCSEYKYRDNQECADAIRSRGNDAA